MLERNLTTYVVVGAIAVAALTALGTVLKAIMYRTDTGSAPSNGWDFGTEAVDTVGNIVVAALGR